MQPPLRDSSAFRLSRGIALLSILQFLGSPAQAQTGNLSLSSGSANAGTGIALNLSLTSGSTASSVQWTLTYDPTSITAISASAGMAATSTGKSITCANGNGSYTCLVSGLNATAIPDGTVAVVNATLAATATGTIPIGIANALGATPNGFAITLNGTAGSIVVSGSAAPPGTAPATLSAVTCNPTTLNSAATSTCTVFFSQAAPAGGAAISLSSNNSLLRVPGSVTASAGSSSANFTATAGSITADQTAVVMATYSGVSTTASLSLSAGMSGTALVTSVACAPATLGTAAASTCTVRMSTPAPTGGLVVLLSSSSAALTAPPSVTVAAASTSATFSVATGSITSDSTAVVTATYNGTSQTAQMSLVAPSGVVSLLTCSPPSLGPAAAGVCTVSLSKPASAGAVVVSLSSNNTGLSVPASVTISIGSSTASFAASATTFTTDQIAEVTASLNGTSQTATLALVAPTVVTLLACSPTSLSSSTATSCTVTLSKPAGDTGVRVALNNSTSALAVSAVITISPGASSASFAATAGNITTNEGAVVTATLNSSSVSVTLSLLASPGPTTAATRSNVIDAAGYTANIAPGGVFVVKGSNLSPNNGFVQASTYPLQTTLNGVSITLTPVNGASSAEAYMIYTFNDGKSNQLAAILPSSVAAGAYNVTVTNIGLNVGTFQTTVVARKFGLITADSTGTGLALAQNAVSQTQYDVNRYTSGSLDGSTYSPAHPGQAIIAWGTGLGAISGPDNSVPGAIDLSNQAAVRVIVGSKTITPFYAGRAPTLAGADQVNFFLPPDVDTGCAVPFQVSVNGQLSNPTTIAIAPPGANACPGPHS